MRGIWGWLWMGLVVGVGMGCQASAAGDPVQTEPAPTQSASMPSSSVPLSTAAAAQPSAASDAGVPLQSVGDASDGPSTVTLPPPNASFDYQLGGAYDLPAGVTVVVRDRQAPPAALAYNICYINGFQVQPGEEPDWDTDLILRDDAGDPIVDVDWNEMLLDVSSEAKRGRIGQVAAGWISSCARAGYDAVEIDNLDSYSRSAGRISEDDAVAFLHLLAVVAHAQGLAIGQKNSTELLARKDELGTDFAIAEECSAWDECGDYVQVYGAHVLMIEYTDADFDKGCRAFGDTHSIVRRDLDLVTPDTDGYVFRGC